jgi:MoaA/NifB/PqqE/SkfB family radical SAM enzyme
VIVITNGALLSESNYPQLREAGVGHFLVSSDLSDERHDEFRRRACLYERLERTIPRLSKLGFREIILNTATTKANAQEILPLAMKAA